MGSIPLPALHLNPPQQQADPVEQFVRLQALKNQMQDAPLRRQALEQQVQQGQMQMQQEQQAQQDQTAFRTAMSSPELQGKSIGEVADVLAHQGAISQGAWVQAKKADTDWRNSLANMDEKQLANQKAAHDATQQLYSNVMNMPDEQVAANWPQIAQQYDSIPGNQKMPLDPTKPLTKQQLAQFAPMISMGNAYFDEELKRRSAVTKQKTDEAELAIKQNEQQYGGNQQLADAKYRFIKQREAAGIAPSADDKAFLTGYEAQKKVAPAAAAQFRVQVGGDVPDTTNASVDSTSQSILAQTGLSLPAFMVLTGNSGSLPRDKATRAKAMLDAQEWANKRGQDISTLASQYKTYNDVLSSNISRLNNTKIMEQELQGTIQNLQGVINDKDLGNLKFVNVARIWAGQEVNDNLAEQYAMHLSQLRNELTAYFAATQGRTGNNITLDDRREAEQVIKNGVARGSLAGLMKAVESSTGKMDTVMQGSVDRARKSVWDLFGVGGNYKKQGSGNNDPLGIR